MTKSKTTILLLLATIVIITMSAASADSEIKTWNIMAGGQTTDMAIQGMSFYPGIITVNVGDTIRWEIGGLVHTISFLSGQVPPPDGSPQSFAPSGGSKYDGTGFVSSGILPTGGDYSLKFTKKGIFSYRCLLHPGMQGIVIVQSAGSRYPFSQKEYNIQAKIDLIKDIDVGKKLVNKVNNMAISSPGPDNTKIWKAFMDIPLPEMVKVNLEQVERSNVRGKATLNMLNPTDLNVKMDVTGLVPNSKHPANIKIGTCNTPGSTEFPLGNIVADSTGRASLTTDINVRPGSGIMNRGWIVTVDKSSSDTDAITCGNTVKHDAAYMRFTPKTLTINQGDSVMWTQLNPMEIHTVSILAAGQIPPELLLPGFIINPVVALPSGIDGYRGTGYYNSGILIPGATYTLKFKKPGIYKYLCLIHDELKMIGYIKVKKSEIDNDKKEV